MANTRIAKYSCLALMGSNKAGELKPDEDGYYEVVVGALNVFNASGVFYTEKKAVELFDDSSAFQRRVRNGNAKGEMGHPKPYGLTKMEFHSRLHEIEETRVACVFSEVWLERKPDNTVLIMAKVKPSGPMGDYLKESLENPKENVCFSIRSFTNPIVIVNGVRVKVITTVITFDVVTEGGIAVANKYDSPALESLVDVTVTEEELLDSYDGLVGNESTGISKEEILKSLGWDKQVNPLPTSSKW